MFKLIEAIRLLRNENMEIRVLAFAGSTPEISPDQFGANNMDMAFRNNVDAKMIVLVGNIHASKKQGVPWDAGYKPIGYLLEHRKPYSVNIRVAAGSMWSCVGDSVNPEHIACGESSIESLNGGSAAMFIPAGSMAFDANLVIHQATASKPATEEKWDEVN